MNRSQLELVKKSIEGLLNNLPNSARRGKDWEYAWNELSDESQISVQDAQKQGREALRVVDAEIERTPK